MLGKVPSNRFQVRLLEFPNLRPFRWCEWFQPQLFEELRWSCYRFPPAHTSSLCNSNLFSSCVDTRASVLTLLVSVFSLEDALGSRASVCVCYFEEVVAAWCQRWHQCGESVALLYMCVQTEYFVELNKVKPLWSCSLCKVLSQLAFHQQLRARCTDVETRRLQEWKVLMLSKEIFECDTRVTFTQTFLVQQLCFCEGGFSGQTHINCPLVEIPA